MSRSISVDEKQRQALDLARRQQRELDALEVEHRGALEALERKQLEARRQLQAAHVRQLVALWRAQGRQVGAWSAPVDAGELPRAFPKPGRPGLTTSNGKGRTP